MAMEHSRLALLLLVALKVCAAFQQADLKASWAGNSKRDFSSHMDASWSSQRQVMPGTAFLWA